MKLYRLTSLMLSLALVLLAACGPSETPRAPSPEPTDKPLPLGGVRVSTLPPPATDTRVPATVTPAPPAATPIPSSTPGCTLQASFIADVTVPDGSVVTPGSQFVKTWRVKNSGTCDWGRGFAAVFVQGNQLGGPTSIAIEPTDAGRTFDVSIGLRAPVQPGAYQGKWQLRSASGTVLTGLTVSIVVQATPTPMATASPTATLKPTPIPTFDATIDSFVGLWFVVTDKFGNNVTDTQRLQQLQVDKAGTQLKVSPATTLNSPYQFGLVGFVSGPYPGGPRMEWAFDDPNPALGRVYLTMTINKLCNATVRLRSSAYDGRFILYQPSCRIPES